MSLQPGMEVPAVWGASGYRWRWWNWLDSSRHRWGDKDTLKDWPAGWFVLTERVGSVGRVDGGVSVGVGNFMWALTWLLKASVGFGIKRTSPVYEADTSSIWLPRKGDSELKVDCSLACLYSCIIGSKGSMRVTLGCWERVSTIVKSLLVIFPIWAGKLTFGSENMGTQATEMDISILFCVGEVGVKRNGKVSFSKEIVKGDGTSSSAFLGGTMSLFSNYTYWERILGKCFNYSRGPEVWIYDNQSICSVRLNP